MQVEFLELIPNTIWVAGGNTGTIAALGHVRRSANGFAFAPATGKGLNELQMAGFDPTPWAADGFSSLSDVAEYLSEK